MQPESARRTGTRSREALRPHLIDGIPLLVALFPLIGLLAAFFVLPEVYGFEED